MALSTARIHRVRGRPPLLAAGINSLIHSHSSSVRSLGYVFSFIYPFYTTHEDFSDRLSGRPRGQASRGGETRGRAAMGGCAQHVSPSPRGPLAHAASFSHPG